MSQRPEDDEWFCDNCGNKIDYDEYQASGGLCDDCLNNEEEEE